MSKALSRLRALVSEIDSIQTQGRKSASPVHHVPVPEESSNVLPMNSKAPEAPPVVTESPEGKVFIQLTGKIAIQLQLEHSEEIVEVRQHGETMEIRFSDGKAIHLPLKNVA